MPLKLCPPRAGRSPYWYVRGTLIGISLDRSTGVAGKAEARIVFKRWERQILSGEYRRADAADVGPRTFSDAALAYIRSGGEGKFLRPILEYNGPDCIAKLSLESIDQISLDKAAASIYPLATAATRNRQFYTPVVAILRRAGIERRFRRPKGWQSLKSVSWLTPDQAFALFAAGDVISPEFGLFLRLLAYTGMRLSEALGIRLEMMNLSESSIYLPKTKNSDPRRVHLTPELVAALANHIARIQVERPYSQRLIRYHAGGRLRAMLKMAMARAGLHFPCRQCGFHLLRHTWASWMRRYGGLDTAGLVETGAWRSRQSASRYEHLDTTEEAKKADLLPTPKRA